MIWLLLVATVWGEDVSQTPNYKWTWENDFGEMTVGFGSSVSCDAHVFVSGGEYATSTSVIAALVGSVDGDFGGYAVLDDHVVRVSSQGDARYSTATATRDGLVVLGAVSESTARGSVGVFERHGLSWQQTAALHSELPGFGRSVATDGRLVAVGASGRVLLFRGDLQVLSLPLDSAFEDDATFGHSLAMAADRLLVGAPGSRTRRGVALVYRRQENNAGGGAHGGSSTTTTTEGTNDDDDDGDAPDQPSASDGNNGGSNGGNGTSGSSSSSSSSSSSGSTTTTTSSLEVSPVVYALEAELSFGDVYDLTGDQVAGFGTAVALAGDVAVVGAPVSGAASPELADAKIGTFSSAVGVFTRSGSAWNLTQVLTPQLVRYGGDPSGDSFGASVALSDDTSLLAVGVPGADGPFAEKAGRVVLYDRGGEELVADPEHTLATPAPSSSGDPEFGLVAEIEAPLASIANQFFGSEVCLGSGSSDWASPNDAIVASAPGADRAFVYRFSATTAETSRRRHASFAHYCERGTVVVILLFIIVIGCCCCSSNTPTRSLDRVVADDAAWASLPSMASVLKANSTAYLDVRGPVFSSSEKDFVADSKRDDVVVLDVHDDQSAADEEDAADDASSDGSEDEEVEGSEVEVVVAEEDDDDDDPDDDDDAEAEEEEEEEDERSPRRRPQLFAGLWPLSPQRTYRSREASSIVSLCRLLERPVDSGVLTELDDAFRDTKKHRWRWDRWAAGVVATVGRRGGATVAFEDAPGRLQELGADVLALVAEFHGPLALDPAALQLAMAREIETHAAFYGRHAAKTHVSSSVKRRRLAERGRFPSCGDGDVSREGLRRAKRALRDRCRRWRVSLALARSGGGDVPLEDLSSSGGGDADWWLRDLLFLASSPTHARGSQTTTRDPSLRAFAPVDARAAANVIGCGLLVLDVKANLLHKFPSHRLPAEPLCESLDLDAVLTPAFAIQRWIKPTDLLLLRLAKGLFIAIHPTTGPHRLLLDLPEKTHRRRRRASPPTLC